MNQETIKDKKAIKIHKKVDELLKLLEGERYYIAYQVSEVIKKATMGAIIVNPNYDWDENNVYFNTESRKES